jgi:hypothetical protein
MTDQTHSKEVRVPLEDTDSQSSGSSSDRSDNNAPEPDYSRESDYQNRVEDSLTGGMTGGSSNGGYGDD